MPPATAAHPPGSYPDIAALGDTQTGFLEGQTQTFPDGSVAYASTASVAPACAPLMAGFMVLIQQKARHDLGFANPLIYAHADSAASHDVTSSSGLGVVRVGYVNGVDASNGYFYILRSLGFDSQLTIHAAAGYDDVTGVGTPNGAAFLSSS